MIQTLKKRLYNGLNRLRNNSVSVLCVLLALSLLVAPAVAQTQVEATDTFEDGNTDGWTGENTQISTESVNGDYSLLTEDDLTSQEENTEWTGGPTLDLTESFTIEGTSRISQDTQRRAGFGLVEPDGTGVLLLFSGEYGETFIATSINEDPSGLETINDYYDNTWVNWEVASSGGGTIQAKVWEHGTTEPSNYQINRSVTPETGFFRVFTGVAKSNRDVYLDDVTISGTTVDTDPTLRLETGNYLDFGETQDFTVYNLVGEREIREDVTADSVVTSGNTSVITVDNSTNELTATTDENVSTRVNITATYNGRTDIRQVTVAEQSISNLDVLPFLGRAGAMFLDRGFQMILVGLLLSIAATRVGGVFAGLGIYQMSLTAGWLIGWVPIGLAMVGLFTTLFIGLNIAANIDYTVRR